MNKIPLVISTNKSITGNVYDVFERFRHYIISDGEVGEGLDEDDIIFVGANDDELIFKAEPHNENLFTKGLKYDIHYKLPVKYFDNYTISKEHLTIEEQQNGESYENLLTKLTTKSEYILNPEVNCEYSYYRIYGRENMPPNYTKEFNGEICTISTFGETINIKVLTLEGTVVDHTYQYKDLDKLTNIQLLRVVD